LATRKGRHTALAHLVRASRTLSDSERLRATTASLAEPAQAEGAGRIARRKCGARVCPAA
jgi:hypothetical protein